MVSGARIRSRDRRGLAFAAALIAVWLAIVSGLCGPPVAAQRSPAPAGIAAVPRTPDGHPDLQGTYDLATMTPLDRPAALGDRLTFTDQEAQRLEQQAANRRERAAEPSRGDRAAPPIGGDGSTGAGGNVGGYNNFWIDSGTSYFAIDGKKRTSIIVDPPNGRVPATTESARRRNAARALPTSDEQESSDPGLGNPNAYNDPEQRPLAERCLLGFGSTSGPPALPVLYNNIHQIVQTKDYVLILNEMNHDARVVRMNGEHLPKTIRRWNGDSIGRWEGDTLVVETTNFTEKTRYRGSTADLKVTERFSRIDARTLLYRFTIEDPETWARPWTGEYVWPATDDLLYEYACHEANHALENIMRGARQRDRQQAGAPER